MRELWWKIRSNPYVCISLACINLLVYLLNRFMGGTLLIAGNLNIYDVLQSGEYGRLIWAMFLHADSAHLFNNMIMVIFMGAILEKEVGHLTFGVIYLLSGICGNICSLVYKVMFDRMSLSIGASGAVFGMDGLMLALVFFSVKGVPSITPVRLVAVIALSLYNGFMSSDIDNAAHVGGLVAGFLMGCIFCVIQRIQYNKKDKRYMG